MYDKVQRTTSRLHDFTTYDFTTFTTLLRLLLIDLETHFCTINSVSTRTVFVYGLTVDRSKVVKSWKSWGRMIWYPCASSTSETLTQRTALRNVLFYLFILFIYDKSWSHQVVMLLLLLSVITRKSNYNRLVKHFRVVSIIPPKNT